MKGDRNVFKFTQKSEVKKSGVVGPKAKMVRWS